MRSSNSPWHLASAVPAKAFLYVNTAYMLHMYLQCVEFLLLSCPMDPPSWLDPIGMSPRQRLPSRHQNSVVATFIFLRRQGRQSQGASRLAWYNVLPERISELFEKPCWWVKVSTNQWPLMTSRRYRTRQLTLTKSIACKSLAGSQFSAV